MKELAAKDERFRIAAMEFIDNRPTYRLRMGSVGESYALEAGRRMGLPEHVLERATSLLDNESQILLSLQKKLEEETSAMQKLQIELSARIKEMELREEAIEEIRKEMKAEVARIKDGQTEEFLKELREKESELENMIQAVQEMMLKTEISKSDKERVIEDVKLAMKDMRQKAETELVERDAGDIATPLTPGEPIEEGITLVILERGSLFGYQGIVTRKNKGRGRVQLRVAGAEIKMERHLLGYPIKSGLASILYGSTVGGNKNAIDVSEIKNIDELGLSAKDRRMLEILRDELVDPDKLGSKGKKTQRQEKLIGLRAQSNTLDIKGLPITEAQAKTMEYLAQLIDGDSSGGSKRSSGAGHPNVIYLHHGNKKDGDIVKPKLRSWLKRNPLVRRLGPAELSDGGDAYTVVELQLDHTEID